MTDARSTSPGRALYELLCTPPHQELGTPVLADSAAYFTQMNPALKQAWERLAQHLGEVVTQWRAVGYDAAEGDGQAAHEYGEWGNELDALRDRADFTAAIEPAYSEVWLEKREVRISPTERVAAAGQEGEPSDG